jgi:hypothetical protein
MCDFSLTQAIFGCACMLQCTWTARSGPDLLPIQAGYAHSRASLPSLLPSESVLLYSLCLPLPSTLPFTLPSPSSLLHPLQTRLLLRNCRGPLHRLVQVENRVNEVVGVTEEAGRHSNFNTFMAILGYKYQLLLSCDAIYITSKVSWCTPV